MTRRLNVQNTTATDPFGGEFLENQMTVSWSASNANGFSFTSNPGNVSTSVDAFNELSHVSNGIFFDSQNPDVAAALAASSPFALPGGNWAVHLDLGGTGLGHSSVPASGLAQAMVLRDLQNPLATHSAMLLTAVAAAQESAFEFVWDPIATILVTKI